jgi:hypothetical protein
MNSPFSEPNRWRLRVLIWAVVAVVLGLLLFFTAQHYALADIWLWGIAITWLVFNGIIYRFTNFIESDPERKSWLSFLCVALVLFLANLTANLSSSAITRQPAPKDPPQRRIVLVGERKFAHWKSFVDGFKLALNKHTVDNHRIGEESLSVSDTDSLGGEFFVERKLKHIVVKIETVQVPDDGDAKQLLAGYARDDNVLMVIGFVTSTKAEEALDALDVSKVEDWPTVILPMATSSKLVSDHNASGKKPILRIVPPNYAQVEPMAEEIVKSSKGANGVSVAIFRDRSNYKYSSDLAESLRSRIESKNVAVVFDGSIGPDGVGSYITDSVVMLRPDYVIFFGMLDTGIPLVRQIQAMKTQVPSGKNWNPIILLSDGSVEKEISGYARKDELRGIHGFFPHGQPLAHWQTCDNGSHFDSPSYTMFGHDAAVFAYEILRTACEEDSKLDRKSVSGALVTVRKKCASGQFPMASSVLVGEYRFDSFGDAIGLKYRVWEFDGSKWALKPNGIPNR